MKGRASVLTWALPSVALLCAMTGSAAVEPTAPVSGEVVALVPDAQKKVLSLPTLADRLKLFAEDNAGDKALRHDKYWKKPRPLVLKWRATAGERGPWKVEIGKSPDLADSLALTLAMPVYTPGAREIDDNEEPYDALKNYWEE